MSLPTPSTSGSSFTFDPKQLQAMEGPLIALANSAGGDLRKLLYAFFSFLHRRTDFYLVPHNDDLKEGKAKMGFPEGEAEKLLLAAFRQFPLRRIPRQQPQQQRASSGATAASGGDKGKKASSDASSPAPESGMSKSDSSSKEQQSTSTAAAATNKTEENKSTTGKAEQQHPSEKIRYTEEGLQEPVGNGGSTKRYRWTQTIDECTVMLGLPEGTRAKDLDVSIKASSILVKTKSKGDDSNVKTFVEGPLVEKIKPDESTWTLEGGVLSMILHKVKKTFWDTIIEGDEKIDTSLVDSRRHISEYDEATQGQLRKIMFDQKQQEKGLPTSDEITGTKTIPPLPAGVEYIDKSTFEEADKKKKG